jgi:hypothetical protein
MVKGNQETFGDFDFAKALEFLDLFPYFKWYIEVHPLQASENLKVNLKRAERQVTTGSNEWEQRLFMELIFLEALENHNIRMWQEKQIDAGNSPFRGKTDFVFTPYQASFKMPYIVLSEAKQDDFEKGWGQCLMAVKSSQIINEKYEYKFDVYGIVSNGKVWEFGKYTTDNKFYKTDAYSIGQLEILLGILNQIFTNCETYAASMKIPYKT